MEYRQAKTRKINAMTLAIMIRALMEGPCTYAELIELTGFFDRTVRDWIREFHRLKLVYVAAWTEDSRGYRRVPAFMWGSKPDVKLKQPTSTERSRTWRLKAKQLKMLHAIHGGTNAINNHDTERLDARQ